MLYIILLPVRKSGNRNIFMTTAITLMLFMNSTMTDIQTIIFLTNKIHKLFTKTTSHSLASLIPLRLRPITVTWVTSGFSRQILSAHPPTIPVAPLEDEAFH